MLVAAQTYDLYKAIKQLSSEHPEFGRLQLTIQQNIEDCTEKIVILMKDVEVEPF